MLVTIATEEEVGIFKGQTAARCYPGRRLKRSLNPFIDDVRGCLFYCSEIHLGLIFDNCSVMFTVSSAMMTALNAL